VVRLTEPLEQSCARQVAADAAVARTAARWCADAGTIDAGDRVPARPETAMLRFDR
jgi:hypothetical protein